MDSLRNWKDYNEALVKRGSILLDLDFVANWSAELKTMNEAKEGARFRYPESFVKLLAVMHAYILPYRQLEGFTRALNQHVDGLKAPDYTTIWWRVTKMKVDLDPAVEPDKEVTIAVDSSGIKVSNRGEWIRHKWQVKRGFIKVHIAVDVRTKQIIAMEITKEEVSDGCMPRRVAVVEQLGNAGWIRAKGYGYRWMAESAFSSIKRVFGEHISSIKWGNIVKELLLKASIYNLFMAMNP